MYKVSRNKSYSSACFFDIIISFIIKHFNIAQSYKTFSIMAAIVLLIALWIFICVFVSLLLDDSQEPDEEPESKHPDTWNYPEGYGFDDGPVF